MKIQIFNYLWAIWYDQPTNLCGDLHGKTHKKLCVLYYIKNMFKAAFYQFNLKLKSECVSLAI